MASFRIGFALLVVLFAATFVSSVAATECDCYLEPDQDCCWLKYFGEEADRVESSSAASILDDGDVSTTAAFPRRGRTLTVGKGKGAYKTIQAAVNAVPDNNKNRIIIYIPNGVYRQKLMIKNKDYVYFKCQSRKTVITWGDTAEKAGGTALSASTAVESEGFIASDCSFVNSAPKPAGGAIGKQAVALRIQGDKGAFYRCGFFGAQDTLYDKAGRHYFRSCDIYGSIDWIFGDGQSFYHFCKIISIATGNSGSVTAQKREAYSTTGFVFFQCYIGGSGSIYLGRAWGTHSRVIFYQCNIANMIRAEGYMDWADPKRQKTIFYAEYKCYGPGANRKGRVKWSKVLNDREARPFSNLNYFINGNQWLEPAM